MLLLKIILILLAVIILGLLVLTPGFYMMNYDAQRWKYKVKPVDYLWIKFSKVPTETLLKTLAFSSTMKQTIAVTDLNMYHHFGVDIFKAFDTYKTIHKAGIKITPKPEEDFAKVLHFAMKGGNLDDLSFAMLKAADSGLDIRIDDLLNLTFAKGNIAKAIELIVEAKNVGMKIGIEELTEHLNKGGKLEHDIEVKIKLHRANLSVSLNDIRRFALEREVDLLVKILIKAKNNNLSLSVDELLAFPNNLDLAQAVNVLIGLHRGGIKSTLKQLELYSHVRDMNELINVMALISSQTTDLNIDFEQIKAFPASGDIQVAIALMLKARQAGIQNLSLSDLSMHLTVKGDIEEFVIAAIKSKEEELNVTVNDLKEFYHVSKGGNGPNLLRAVELLIITRSQNIELKLKDMRRHLAEKGDIEKLVRALLISKHEKLGVTLEDLEKHFHQGGNVEQFVIALRISAHEELGYTKEELLLLHNNNVHVLDLIRALRVNKRENLGIPQQEIEKIFNEGLDVLKIIYALINAKHSGMQIKFDYAVAIERSNEIDIEEAVKWALHPKVINCPVLKVVAKNGIEMTTQIKVKVRGKISQFFGGAREDVVFDRVRAAIVNEMIKYNTHKELSEHRDEIARNAFEKIANEEEFNKNSAYEIIGIFIPEIWPSNDTNAALRREIAELDKELTTLEADKRNIMLPILEKEAKIKEINERAEKEKNIGLAFKEGTIRTNEYYKYKANKK